jgi:hypothetical protein
MQSGGRSQDGGCSLCGLLLQQSINEDLSVKRCKIICAFAEADELDRNAQLDAEVFVDALLEEQAA